MLSTRTRLLAIAGAAIVCVFAVTAVASASGPPQSLNVLLCGTTSGFSADRVSGNSSIDHPSGLSASGQEYGFDPSNPSTCQGKNNGSGGFSWAIKSDNVNLSTERGNEHAAGESTMLAETANFDNGFDGAVYEYDFSPNNDPGSCSGSRTVYYASGHAFDATCAPGSGPGNFNTHGGAASNNHYNGKYGVLIYQDDSSAFSGCNSTFNPGVFCFQAIIEGQLN